VLDPANQRRMTADSSGRTRHYYQIDWQGRRIWGATAAMLVNLTRRDRMKLDPKAWPRSARASSAC
jgi:hypothetical protein